MAFKLTHRRGSFLAHDINDINRAEELAAHGDEHFGRFLCVAVRRWNENPFGFHQRASADSRPRAIHLANDAFAWGILKLSRLGNVERPLLGFFRDRFAQRVLGKTLGGGRDTDQLLGADAVHRLDARHFGRAQRQRACLVEHDDI